MVAGPRTGVPSIHPLGNGVLSIRAAVSLCGSRRPKDDAPRVAGLLGAAMMMLMAHRSSERTKAGFAPADPLLYIFSLFPFIFRKRTRVNSGRVPVADKLLSLAPSFLIRPHLHQLVLRYTTAQLIYYTQQRRRRESLFLKSRHLAIVGL